MKKIFFISAAILLLAGCQSGSPDTPLKNVPANPDKISEFTKDFVYTCDGRKSFTAKMNEAGNKVLFIEPGNNPVELDQTISASGIRYADSDEKTVFWGKGDTAFVEQDGVKTYDNCVTTDNSSDKQNTDSHESAQNPEMNGSLPNPASENCVQKGGNLKIMTKKDGQYGVCFFDDNRQCEEWALYRGQCPTGGLKVTGYQTDPEVYCAITGGEVQGLDTDTPMCKRVDGTLCTAQANYDGDCPDPNVPDPSAGNTEAP